MAIFFEALALGWSADLVPKVSRNSYFESFSHLLEAVIRPNFAAYVLTSPPTLEWNCGRIEQVDWKKILYVYIYIYNTIQYRCSATSIYWILSSYSNEETCRLSLFSTRPSHRYSLIATPVLLILLLPDTFILIPSYWLSSVYRPKFATFSDFHFSFYHLGSYQ